MPTPVSVSLFSACHRSQPACPVAHSASPAGAGSTVFQRQTYTVSTLRNVIKSTIQLLSKGLGSLRSSSWTWRPNAPPLCHSPTSCRKKLRVRPRPDSLEKLCSNPTCFPPKNSLLCLPLSPGKAAYPRLPAPPSKRLLAECHPCSRRDPHSCILALPSKRLGSRAP